MSWIVTYTGRRFPLEKPEPSDIALEDIAAALSNLCRWGGHVRRFYSVAAHAVMVSHLAEELSFTGTPADRRSLGRWGLLHDAAEAYLGDVVSPLKGLLPRYELLEAGVLRAVARHFSLDGDEIPTTVRRADRLALALEARHLVYEGGMRHAFMRPHDADDAVRILAGRGLDAKSMIETSTPETARERFVARFDELRGAR